MVIESTDNTSRPSPASNWNVIPDADLVIVLVTAIIVLSLCTLCVCCHPRCLGLGARLRWRATVNHNNVLQGVATTRLVELRPQAHIDEAVTPSRNLSSRKKKQCRVRFKGVDRKRNEGAFSLVLDGVGGEDEIVGATDVESADDGSDDGSDGGNNGGNDGGNDSARQGATSEAPAEGSWLAVVLAFERLAKYGVVCGGHEEADVADVNVELLAHAIVLLSHTQHVLGPFMHPAAMNDRKFADQILCINKRYGGVGTLRLLLELERAELTKNGEVPYKENELPDDSAAICATWLMRGIFFWSGVALRISRSHSDLTLSQAAAESYQDHLEPFHKWLLQKAFGAGIAMVPSKSVFFDRVMALPGSPSSRNAAVANHQRVCIKLMKRFVKAASVTAESMCTVLSDLSLVDKRKV